ncbi:hypothetical protein I5L28_14750 [Serratia marcescens]|jgi:hypothetical protein|nr:hypothetical protein [Serratia marcescens]
MNNETLVSKHYFMFILKNNNGSDISCVSEVIATKEQALSYFSSAVEGLNIEIIEISNEGNWKEEHNH